MMFSFRNIISGDGHTRVYFKESSAYQETVHAFLAQLFIRHKVLLCSNFTKSRFKSCDSHHFSVTFVIVCVSCGLLFNGRTFQSQVHTFEAPFLSLRFLFVQKDIRSQVCRMCHSFAPWVRSLGLICFTRGGGIINRTQVLCV